MQPPSPVLLRVLRRATRVRAHEPIYRSSNWSQRVRPFTSSLVCRSGSSNGDSVSRVGTSAYAPASTNRGPASTESTQTDFGALNVLGSVTPPSTAIDACRMDGFVLDNGTEIRDGCGCLLVQGEAFRWRPWEAVESRSGSSRSGLPPAPAMLNSNGQWEVDASAFGLLECVWPKPELLILGLGASMHPLSPDTKHRINALGIRLDVQDTRNAAAQFNMLATERGVGTVAAALLPLGWRGR